MGLLGRLKGYGKKKLREDNAKLPNFVVIITIDNNVISQAAGSFHTVNISQYTTFWYCFESKRD